MNVSSTTTNGANLTYEFSGTSISLFGFMQISEAISSANYTIDDQEPITFNVGGSTVQLLNKMFFESGQLSPGQHKLVVTYLNNSNMPMPQPLAVNYFVQQDAPYSTSSNSPTSVPSGSTPTSISVPSGSSSNDFSPGKPITDAIIGGVIGGLVFISLLIALFVLICRRNNRRSSALSEMSYTVPSPDHDFVNPFTLSPLNPTSTFLPENYTSNGQSLPSHSIPSKFNHINQPSDPASTSNSGGIRVPPLTPLRRPQQFSSFAFISESPLSESPGFPLTGQTGLDSARPRVQEATTSSQRDDARFLLDEDGDVRIPPAEDQANIVEFPPFYTLG